jgi:hypothetical protein
VIRLTFSGLLLVAGCTVATGPHYYGDDDGPIGNGVDGGGSNCTAVALAVTPVTPAIQLMIDGSGSMGETIGGTVKYNAVANALVDSTNGLVTKLQARAAFGAAVYTSEQCPKLYASACTLNNAAGINTAITNGGNANHYYNPVVEAITSVVGTLAAGTGKHKTIVLATDGVPNQCNSNAGDRTDEAVAEVSTAFGEGIGFFIIGLGNTGSTAYLQKMANAGVGATGGTNAQYWDANSQADVTAAYQAIFDKVLDCELSVDGTIDLAQASTGTVKSNATTLGYTTDWIALDAHTIQLVGATCTAYKAAVTAPEITATFACGATKP